MIKRLIHQALGSSGRRLIYTRGYYDRDGLFTVHSDHFRQDPVFQSAYQRGLQANNGVDPQFEWRLHVALWLASNALAAQGDFVECGVNTGFMSSAIMDRLDWGNVSRRFYLIDTFTGPVVSQFSNDEVRRGRREVAEDMIEKGAYETNITRVRANFAEWPNSVVVQGAVPDILHQIDIATVAFLHLDMNCAYPEREALEYFWSRLSPGAFVLMDDYAYHDFESQMKSIDAMAQSFGFDVLSLPTGQGVIMKR